MPAVEQLASKAISMAVSPEPQTSQVIIPWTPPRPWGPFAPSTCDPPINTNDAHGQDFHSFLRSSPGSPVKNWRDHPEVQSEVIAACCDLLRNEDYTAWYLSLQKGGWSDDVIFFKMFHQELPPDVKFSDFLL